MITFHNGNILDSGADYICHQVNCQGKMNSGVAKSIRERWFEVYDWYTVRCNTLKNDALGSVQLVPVDGKIIINMFAQEYYGYDGKKYTSYDAFWSCLEEIKESVSVNEVIAFPARIGCVRGGANWNVILKMIEEVLGDYNVEIWDYDKG